MGFIKFAKGLKSGYTSNYQSEDYIYFATDEQVIYSGGKAYGITEADKGKLNSSIKTIEITDDNKLKITTTNGDTNTISLKEVSDTVSGLMTPTQKAALEKATSDIANLTEAVQINKVQSTDKTITVTAGIASEGNITPTNLSVNIDNETIVKNGDGKLSASVVYTGENAIDVTNKKITLKIAEANKVLSQSSDGLTTTLKFVDDSENNKIKLVGLNDTEVASFDYAKFIVDGMLDDAEINEDNELVLTMNTAAGSKELKVDLTKYIDVYTAGNGITVTGKVITAKAKEGDKYVEVTEDGIASKGIDTAISTAVDAAKTELQEAIEDLDVTDIGGTGKYIQVVGQANGKITATAQDLTAANTAVTDIDGLTLSSKDVQTALKALVDMWQWHEA